MVNCPICDKNCKTPAGLTQHTLQVHKAKSKRQRASPNLAKAVNNLARGGNFAPGVMPDMHFPTLLSSAIGRTPTGRAWAMAALHPCGRGELISPLIGDLQGMPDTMTGAVVTPTYPGENVINFDTTLFPTPPETPTGTWGVDIIVPSIPEIDYLYRIRYDATNLNSHWRVVRLPNMALPLKKTLPADDILQRGTTFASLGYGKVRCIGSGHTFELDATDMNNQGRVVVAQLDGQWSDLKLPFGRANVTTDVFVTVVDPLATASAVTGVSVASSAYGTADLQVLSIPVDPQVLVAACPSSYQADAKFGAYVVQKFSSPLLGYQFKPSGDDGVFVTDTDAEGNQTYMPMTAFGINTFGYNNAQPVIDNLELLSADSNFGTSMNFGAPLIDSNTDAPNPNNDAGEVLHPWVTRASDMMTSVITFRNLALTSTATGAATIRVKSRNYFECVPNAQNPATTPFTHQPAAYDPPALDAVITVGKQLADGYPASYNDLGEMLGQMWDGVKELVHPIASEIGKMGIPVVSGIAKEIGDSIHTNSDRLNSLMSRASHMSKGTNVPSAFASVAHPLMNLTQKVRRFR